MSSLQRASSVRVGPEPSKLIVLAADKHIAASLEVLIERRRADLGIPPISFDVRRHPESDPGCRTKAVDFLRPLVNQYRWALVIFDHQGCGSTAPREKIQREVELGLERNGWQGRSKAIVIAPELESWVWSPTGDVAHALGWGRDFDQLRAWLADAGLWPGRQLKPTDPKEATRQALRRNRKVLSSALFKKLAVSVQIDGCRDPAFKELLTILQAWFPRPVDQ